MDPELKAYLEGMEARLREHFEKLPRAFSPFARLSAAFDQSASFSKYAKNSEARRLELKKRVEAIERKLESRNGGGKDERVRE